jgi:flavin-dependent dehydrogenase
VPAVTEIQTDVLIIGASLAGAAAAKRTVDAGFRTITIEKKELPRHKICSGILSPRGYAFLRENFGEPPDNAFHTPKWVTGVNFLFPNGLQLPMPFIPGPTPHIYRKFADHHVVKESRTEIHERTEFRDIATGANDVLVKARRVPGGEEVAYRAKYVIAADGPRSEVVAKLYPEFRDSIYWFVVGQKYYAADLDLDSQWFHFTINSQLGYYTWTHAENGCHIIGYTDEHGEPWPKGHARAVEYFERDHGLRVREEVFKEGCLENFGMSLTNNFVFGKRRVLVTGQAAGFLNMMAEGMSCAMHSGAIAGESIVESFTRNRDANAVYDNLIQSERRRTVDQWNPLRILFDNPHEADLKAAIMKWPLSDRTYMVKEMLAYIRQFRGYHWVRPILSAAAKRLFLGRY